MNTLTTLFFSLLAILFSFTKLSAQTNLSWQGQVVDYVESHFSDDNQPDIEQLLGDLEFLFSNPININTADPNELNKLAFLNPIQIQNLIQYRENYGTILSKFELKAIDGFDEQLIRLIEHLLSYEEVAADSTKYIPKQEMIVRGIHLLEKQKGYKEPRKYEGSPLKFYARYRYTTPKIQAGITAEKDAGEPFFKASNKYGFDYYSAFAAVSFPQKKHQVLLGDYRLQFGQGLVAWQGFSMGKSADINAGAKFNQGIYPYTSTDENNYMRGIAAKVKHKKFTIFPFYSFKKFDANTDSIYGIPVFTSFQTSGLHRTKSEIEDKNSVREESFGAYIQYTGKFYSLGFSGIQTYYGKALYRRESAYNRYLFEGNNISNYALDYKIGLNNYFLFGEIAGCSTNGIAYLGGVLAKPMDKTEFSIVFREISKQYNSPFGNAFLENSRVNDEQGIFLGLKLLPIKNLSVSSYVDFFKYRWVKYTTYSPGSGNEFQLQINYKLSEYWNIYSRYFNEVKPVNATVNSQKLDLDQKREKLRFHLDGELSNIITLRSRLEFIFYKHDHSSKGILIFQDIGIKSEKLNSNCWFRISYFNTDDYDSRVYAYENDLLYQFSIPAFYRKGIRAYMSGKVKICEKTDLWFKASRTWFSGVESIGSGSSMIDGSKRTELKMQLRVRF